MTQEIELVAVEERPIVAVRAKLAMADIPAKVFPLMDRVWAFVRCKDIQDHGHNVWLYRPRSNGEFEVEIGVEMAGPVAGKGDVVSSRTPGGRTAHAVHYGDYSELPGVHEAVFAWCREHGLVSAGTNWEVYGDWEEDPAKRRTDVYHLVE